MSVQWLQSGWCRGGMASGVLAGALWGGIVQSGSAQVSPSSPGPQASPGSQAATPSVTSAESTGPSLAPIPDPVSKNAAVSAAETAGVATGSGPMPLPPAPLPEVSEAIPVAGANEPAGAMQRPDDSLVPKLSATELQSLVAPVALYADEVLDNVLDAVQYPVAVRQGATLAENPADEASRLLLEQLPGSVRFLREKHQTVLDELNKNLVLMTRLGLAVKTQPDDVVAAIREVRAQTAALAKQTAAEPPAATEAVSLPVVGAIGGPQYFADGGVYANAYPNCGYYTYGMPQGYYATPFAYGYCDPWLYSGFGLGGFGYGGWGYGGWGYPGYYGWGTGYPAVAITRSVTRLVLGLAWINNNPGWWGPYGFYGPGWYGNPYWGFGYGWGRGPYAAGFYNGFRQGYWTGIAQNPWGNPVGWGAGQGWGWNNGWSQAFAGRGWGSVTGPWGRTGQWAASGLAGRTWIGNTALFGGAGTFAAVGPLGRGGSATGWLRGQATVIGNSASWHTQAAGLLQGNRGVSSLFNHTGQGSLIAYADGSRGWSRSAQNILTGNRGSLTVSHESNGLFRGNGFGNYTGSTNFTGSQGRGGTFSSAYASGEWNRSFTPNNPNGVGFGQLGQANSALAERFGAGANRPFDGVGQGNTLGQGLGQDGLLASRLGDRGDHISQKLSGWNAGDGRFASRSMDGLVGEGRLSDVGRGGLGDGLLGSGGLGSGGLEAGALGAGALGGGLLNSGGGRNGLGNGIGNGTDGAGRGLFGRSSTNLGDRGDRPGFFNPPARPGSAAATANRSLSLGGQTAPGGRLSERFGGFGPNVGNGGAGTGALGNGIGNGGGILGNRDGGRPALPRVGNGTGTLGGTGGTRLPNVGNGNVGRGNLGTGNGLGGNGLGGNGLGGGVLGGNRPGGVTAPNAGTVPRSVGETIRRDLMQNRPNGNLGGNLGGNQGNGIGNGIGGNRGSLPTIRSQTPSSNLPVRPNIGSGGIGNGNLGRGTIGGGSLGNGVPRSGGLPGNIGNGPRISQPQFNLPRSSPPSIGNGGGFRGAPSMGGGGGGGFRGAPSIGGGGGGGFRSAPSIGGGGGGGFRGGGAIGGGGGGFRGGGGGGFGGGGGGFRGGGGRR
jgi:hypothetical protein